MLQWHPNDLDKIRRGRHRARTDLIWLSQRVLGFDRVDRRVNGPMVDTLVKFDSLKGEDELSIHDGQLIAQWHPEEDDPAEALAHEARKKRLIMDPRGWFKTTLNCVAHSIQINLNFPNVGIAIIHANSDAAADIVGGQIRPRYTESQAMRWLFPEFCTQWNPRTGRYLSSGNMSRFTTPARNKPFPMPTFYALGANSALASKHFHWIKFTDVVNDKNYLSDDQLAKVTKMYSMSRNLLIDPRYFIDVEGTSYKFTDLYNEHIIEKEEKLPEDKKTFHIFLRGAFERKPPEGQEERFLPEERDWPFVIRCPEHLQEEGTGLGDEKCSLCGRQLLPVSRWPEAWPLKDLLQMRSEDAATFATQQLNDPSAGGDEGKIFPLSKMFWFAERHMSKIPFRYFTMTVDLAETISTTSDFTAMCVMGWDNVGRGYVVDAIQGRWLPETKDPTQLGVLDLIFSMYRKWKCRFLRIEASSYGRGLLPAMERRMVEEKYTIALDWLKRDPGESKKERINSLQPFWNSGSLRFSDGLSPYVVDQLKKQFDRHPAGRDDLLDCIADQYQGKTDFARVTEREDQAELQKKAQKALLFDRQAWLEQFAPSQPTKSPFTVV